LGKKIAYNLQTAGPILMQFYMLEYLPAT